METEAEIDEWLVSEATCPQERILKTMVEVQVAKIEKCPHCGGKLRGKGHKGKQMVTTQGQTAINREYYYCPNCQQGIYPPR